MKTNTKHKKFKKVKNHTGLLVNKTSSYIELRRSVLCCLLFEDNFYENGISHAERIRELIKKCSFEEVADLAREARLKFKLRHIPLFLTRELIRNYGGRKVGDLVYHVIRRPDEMCELLAMYWEENDEAPISNQLKIGLARALKRFDEYQLSKYNSKNAALRMKLIPMLAHPKPRDGRQSEIFKRLLNDNLNRADTWETALSSGENKKQTFERLMRNKKLGALALLRNLRGMLKENVDINLMKKSILEMNTKNILPFRFIAAAGYAPRLEPEIEKVMLKELARMEKLPGKTALLIDHSSSMMHNNISAKSEISRFDAAIALAIMLREISEECAVFTFSDTFVEIPARRGFALGSEIKRVIRPAGTLLGAAVRKTYQVFPQCERVIVITDEQSYDKPPNPKGKGYIINVASYANGITYKTPWVGISGWSEAILKFIMEYENNVIQK